jgi:phage FluMu gp28-like protein
MGFSTLWDAPANLISAANDTWLKKENMKNQMISRAPELDESEIKALIENFDTIGMLLKEHVTIVSNPILTPESKKMCDEGLVLIKKFTQKCLEHYGMRYLPK